MLQNTSLILLSADVPTFGVWQAVGAQSEEVRLKYENVAKLQRRGIPGFPSQQSRERAAGHRLVHSHVHVDPMITSIDVRHLR